MMFAAPEWKWVFLGVLVAVVLGVLEGIRKGRALKTWVAPLYWKRLMMGWSPHLESRNLILWGLGMVFVVFALMRPQYGVVVEKINRQGQDILLVLDVSKSMGAQDVKPSRLGYAKQELGLLIDRLKGDRVGLIVFAGAPYVQSPLTFDYASVALYVEGAYSGMLSEPGTRLGEALRSAAHALRAQNNKFKAVVVVTDGETFDETAPKQAEALEALGARLYIVGVGTVEGDPIPDVEASGEVIGLKKNEAGDIVLSKRQDSLLSQLASKTHGLYWPVDRNTSVADVIYQDISKQDKQRLESSIEKRQVDRYHWPLLGALLCFMGCWFWPGKLK